MEGLLLSIEGVDALHIVPLLKLKFSCTIHLVFVINALIVMNCLAVPPSVLYRDSMYFSFQFYARGKFFQ